MIRPKEKICRSFKRDFPEFVEQIEQLGLQVHAQRNRRVNDMPTYYLEDAYQLTGYRTTDGGKKFTKETATALIRKLLQSIVDGRDEVAQQTREQRFRNVIAGMKTIKLRYNNFCYYGHPSGDTGTILYDAAIVGWVRLWDEKKDCAHAEYYPVDQIYDALAVSFRNGGATISNKGEDGGQQRREEREAAILKFKKLGVPLGEEDL
jgi:hypothetical protein